MPENKPGGLKLKLRKADTNRLKTQTGRLKTEPPAPDPSEAPTMAVPVPPAPDASPAPGPAAAARAAESRADGRDPRSHGAARHQPGEAAPHSVSRRDGQRHLSRPGRRTGGEERDGPPESGPGEQEERAADSSCRSRCACGGRSGGPALRRGGGTTVGPDGEDLPAGPAEAGQGPRRRNRSSARPRRCASRSPARRPAAP